MPFVYVPLLEKQRELYAIPRGMERFTTYIATITGDTDDIALPPLGGLNPMAHDHVNAYLDELIAMNADDLAAHTVAEASHELAALETTLNVSLIVADDLKGGWTNRYFAEMTYLTDLRPSLKRGWTTIVLWSSEQPSPNAIRWATRAALYRAAYQVQHGPAITLRQMLQQEGQTLRYAGTPTPPLDAEELAYTREMITPHLDATEYATIIPCLFGDAAADSLGYATLGLSPRAGFALALHEAEYQLG